MLYVKPRWKDLCVTQLGYIICGAHGPGYGSMWGAGARLCYICEAQVLGCAVCGVQVLGYAICWTQC